MLIVASEIPAGDVATDWWSILVQVVTTFGGLLTIVALLFGGFMWLVKPRAKQWVEGIAAKLDSAEKNTQQLTPNNGTHLYDAVSRIETKVDKAAQLAEANSSRLESHIRLADKSITLYRYVLSQSGIHLPEVKDE